MTTHDHTWSAAQTAAWRFWSKVAIDPTTGCWEWTAYRDRQGYGRFGVDGTNWLAHRLAWLLTHGTIEPDRVIRHTCDNPPCINPDHLLVGTQADNIKDRQDRGRHRPGRLAGESHGQAKLTWEQVRDLRSRTYRRGDKGRLCAELGITRPTLRRILDGSGWKEKAA
jgi:hypothetical protein